MEYSAITRMRPEVISAGSHRPLNMSSLYQMTQRKVVGDGTMVDCPALMQSALCPVIGWSSFSMTKLQFCNRLRDMGAANGYDTYLYH